MLSAAELVGDPLPAASVVGIAAAAPVAPAATAIDGIAASVEDGDPAVPAVAAGTAAALGETIAADPLCASVAELDAAGSIAVELEAGGLVRAGAKAAVAGAAGGGRLPLGGKDVPLVPAVAALPGSLLRLLLPVT